MSPTDKEDRLFDLQLKELELRVNKLRDEESDRHVKMARKQDKERWDAGMDIFFQRIKRKAARDIPGTRASLNKMRARYPQSAKRAGRW